MSSVWTYAARRLGRAQEIRAGQASAVGGVIASIKRSPTIRPNHHPRPRRTPQPARVPRGRERALPAGSVSSSRRSFAGETVVRGSARFVAPDEPVPLAAGGGVVTSRVALGEGPLPHFGDQRRPLEQSQHIQPTGEPLRFVASFANEHSLDPPVLGWGELQDKAHTPTLASSSHTRMLRSRTRPSPQGRTRGFHVTDLGRQVST